MQGTFVWDIVQDVIGSCDIINEPFGPELSLPTLSALDAYVDPQLMLNLMIILS